MLNTYNLCVLGQPGFLKPGQDTDEFNHLELEVIGSRGHRNALRTLQQISIWSYQYMYSVKIGHQSRPLSF